MSAQNKGMIEKEFVESLIAYQNDICNSFKKRAEAAEAKLAELAELEIEKNETQGCLEMLRDDYKEMSQRAEAAEAKCKQLQAARNQAEWVISGEQQNVRVLQGRESALNAEILALRELLPKGNQEPAAWMVGGWAYHDKRSAERRSQYDNLLMEPLYLRPAPAADLAELVPSEWSERAYDDKDIGYESGWNDCIAAILRNIEEAK